MNRALLEDLRDTLRQAPQHPISSSTVVLVLTALLDEKSNPDATVTTQTPVLALCSRCGRRFREGDIVAMDKPGLVRCIADLGCAR